MKFLGNDISYYYYLKTSLHIEMLHQIKICFLWIIADHLFLRSFAQACHTIFFSVTFYTL